MLIQAGRLRRDKHAAIVLWFRLMDGALRRGHPDRQVAAGLRPADHNLEHMALLHRGAGQNQRSLSVLQLGPLLQHQIRLIHQRKSLFSAQHHIQIAVHHVGGAGQLIDVGVALTLLTGLILHRLVFAGPPVGNQLSVALLQHGIQGNCGVNQLILAQGIGLQALLGQRIAHFAAVPVPVSASQQIDSETRQDKEHCGSGNRRHQKQDHRNQKQLFLAALL